MAKSQDLFDDTTMTFGEHLEVLRLHLWRAIVGLIFCVIVAFFFADRVVDVIRRPIDNALKTYNVKAEDDVSEMKSGAWNYLKNLFGGEGSTPPVPAPKPEPLPDSPDTILVELDVSQLVRALHDYDPESYPQPKTDTAQSVSFVLKSKTFEQFQHAVEEGAKPIVLTVQEAFLTYLKVAFVTGFVLASPWVFYQLWLFVAAGLYPHERNYVRIYLPFSLTLFLVGVVFCFFVVFPFVLKFLLGFATMLGVTPQIRLSEWISFALMLPVMFGLSFQLPLVMLFLERISIFDANDYRAKRRMAILVISILSMLMTPPDPMSMLMMMCPLFGLYELGILLCGFSPGKRPLEAEAV